MTARSTYRGHTILFTNWEDQKGGEWKYEDGVSIKEERPCVRCNKMPAKEGYDACLGHIPGAIGACCGHGVSEPILMMEGE